MSKKLIVRDKAGNEIVQIEGNCKTSMTLPCEGYSIPLTCGLETIRLNFGEKVAFDEETIIDDFNESYTVDIGAELVDYIMDTLINQGLDSDTAHKIAQSVYDTTIEVDVTISHRDEDVSVDHVSVY